MTVVRRCRTAMLVIVLGVLTVDGRGAYGQSPVLNLVAPAGGEAGGTVEVTVSGQLQGLRTLYCNAPGVRCEQKEPARFELSIPKEVPPGLYDLWAVSDRGVSAPRTFVIGNRPERRELEPNDAAAVDAPVPVDIVLNGQIEKPGDVDQFRFEAKRGQRVVIECRAERIDSRLRAVIELFDAAGRRLAVNRGFFGIDPLIDFQVPADGFYVVAVEDLISSGSPEHYYRLEIDTGPRVAFSVPNVIPRDQPARVTLYGWNLHGNPGAVPTTAGSADNAAPAPLDRIEVEIPAAEVKAAWPFPVRMRMADAVVEGFPFHWPGSAGPVVIGVTDVPVVLDRDDNHSPAAAQEIEAPCEVSGRLEAGEERDWFAVAVRRGEVLHLEGLGQRIQSPVDLQISIFDAAGTRELAAFGDERRNIGGLFRTDHLDPAGRWVCPSDGRYLIVMRNLTGGLASDARRLYRLGVRREEPDFQVVAVPRQDVATGLNVQSGGRAAVDLIALRQRGMNGPIRVSAKDLPPGIDCPDVWFGPGVNRATAVISAERNVSNVFATLALEASVEEESGAMGDRRRAVRGGAVVRAGMPTGWSRLVSQIPWAVAGDAPVRITANAHESLEHPLYGRLEIKHSPGGIVDVAVDLERREAGHGAPVKLIAVGLPDLIGSPTAIIPEGAAKGYLSFYLPPGLPPGRYSLAIQAETTVPKDGKAVPVTVVSNPVTLTVEPAAFVVEVDPFVVRQVRRGETIQVSYTASRINGFIGKMHTELASPGIVTTVVGLRGRGVTFVGQTEDGEIQIVVNDDAPLGRLPFLRLLTVGVLEDEPTWLGGSFLPLEIVE